MNGVEAGRLALNQDRLSGAMDRNRSIPTMAVGLPEIHDPFLSGDLASGATLAEAKATVSAVD